MSKNHGGVRLLPVEEQKLGISNEKQVVQAEALSQLRESGYHELHFVSCDFHEGVLTLRGTSIELLLEAGRSGNDPPTGQR